MTREDLQFLLQTESGPTDMKPHEKTMIHRIFRFADTKVKEVMIPLVEVVALEENSTIGEAIASVRQENYSRYPVFQERVDNITGVIHSFDLLLASNREQTIQPYIRPISFFPETKPIDELLLDLQRKQEALAVVVDEYGGAVGIVTVEDILEEVVGEIEDEYDTAQPLFRKVGPKAFLINARMEIDHINEISEIGPSQRGLRDPRRVCVEPPGAGSLDRGKLSISEDALRGEKGQRAGGWRSVGFLERVKGREEKP